MKCIIGEKMVNKPCKTQVKPLAVDSFIIQILTAQEGDG